MTMRRATIAAINKPATSSRTLIVLHFVPCVSRVVLSVVIVLGNKSRRYSRSSQLPKNPTRTLSTMLRRILLSAAICVILCPCWSLAKVCLPVEDDRYLCTDDPVKLRAAAVKHDPYNSPLSQYYSSDGLILASVFGEPQREDGSETEVEAVKMVLQEMYEYFNEQVLVLPEYKTVRDICKNKHDLCAFWTSIGECDVNRRFMVNECSASCRLCLHLHSSFRDL